MEDDVAFNQPLARFAARMSRALASLPEGWRALYLGHVPVQAYFVGFGLLRARSGALHAYIANAPMLEWYAAHRPRAAEIPMWSFLSPGVDAATSLLPGMYALFPMIAFQKDLGDRRIDSVRTVEGRRRRLFDFDRYRNLVLFRGMRIAEMLAVLASPFHWLTMDWLIARIDRSTKSARLIRASGLFDDEFYLKAYSDIAAAKADPLSHYLEYGAKEGRWPNASFDPRHYAEHAGGMKPGENALLHYISVGRARGCPTHPASDRFWKNVEDIRASGLFDEEFYLAAYPDIAAARTDPLHHYLKHGAREGRWPNASFDPRHYARHATDLKPDENPLLHYLAVGRARGYPTCPAAGS